MRVFIRKSETETFVTEINKIKCVDCKEIGKIFINVDNCFIEIEVPVVELKGIQSLLLRYGFFDLSDYKAKIEYL